jgi:hypothetical protein
MKHWQLMQDADEYTRRKLRKANLPEGTPIEGTDIYNPVFLHLPHSTGCVDRKEDDTGKSRQIYFEIDKLPKHQKSFNTFVEKRIGFTGPNNNWIGFETDYNFYGTLYIESGVLNGRSFGFAKDYQKAADAWARRQKKTPTKPVPKAKRPKKRRPAPAEPVEITDEERAYVLAKREEGASVLASGIGSELMQIWCNPFSVAYLQGFSEYLNVNHDLHSFVSPLRCELDTLWLDAMKSS